MKKQNLLKNIQFVIFTPPFEAANKIGFANDFIQKTDNVFAHDPQIVSLPKQAPPEVSRIVLKNAELTHEVHFAQNRVTFIYQDVKNLNPDMEAVYPGFRFLLSKIVQALFELTHLPFIRFGMVVSFLKEYDEGTNRLFSEKYLVGNPIPDAHEIQMNFHHILKIDNFNVNRWIRYQTLRKKDKQEEDSGLAVSVDLNTFMNINLSGGPTDALNFFMGGKTHIVNDLGNFPFMGE